MTISTNKPLLSLSIKAVPKHLKGDYPFSLISKLTTKSITFSSPVMFFVGENGSGKSTLLEAIAGASLLPTVGSKNFDDDETLVSARNLSKYLKLSWGLKSNRGFFLRAEDFFGFTKRLNQLRIELAKEITRLNTELPDGYGKQIAVGSLKAQIDEMTTRYGVDLGACSHGEGFLRLFLSRIKPNGLYLLDEPETPLSPTRQMSLLKIIKDAVGQNCQFIIATHSPIIMSYPNSSIIDFNSKNLKKVNYEETDHVKITKDFLNHKDLFLRRIFE